MHLIDTIRKTFVPIHPAGYPFIAGFFVASLVLGLLWEPLFWIGLVITAWSAYFFRDPERMTPLNSEAVFSPADGIVSAVGPARPPAELDLGDQDFLRISVFMNVFSCHVNRTPADGPIRRIAYRKGAFLNADLDKASSENERNGLVIEAEHGDIGVVQVAGLVARRILCFVEEGQTVAAGERIGLIRFGSRLDVYLPSAYQPAVALGQTAIAGETRIAFVGPGGTMPPMVRRD